MQPPTFLNADCQLLKLPNTIVRLLPSRNKSPNVEDFMMRNGTGPHQRLVCLLKGALHDGEHSRMLLRILQYLITAECS